MKLSWIFIIGLFLSGCASTPTGPKKYITDWFEPVYMPKFSFKTKNDKSTPSGYAISVINLTLTAKSTPPNAWVIRTPQEKQYESEFIDKVAHGIDKVYVSNGVTVLGPFSSVSEMTYPQKKRSDFIINPTLALDFFNLNCSAVKAIDGYPLSPSGKGYKYGVSDCSITAKSKLEYNIIDPMTKEKLERHTVKIEDKDFKFKIIHNNYINKNKKGEVIKEWWQRTDEPAFHNDENVVGKIFDHTFTGLMKKIETFVSIDEFNNLNKFKKELRKMKRF